MTTGIILLNFGEPTTPDESRIVEYLERIFLANADVESGRGGDAASRARALAERRAPGLVEEYEAIGGSPLDQQSADQAEALEATLHDRGFTDVTTYVGMQYTDPLVEDAVARARADDVDTLVGLPVYPLSGPSTTVAALQELDAAVEALDWDVISACGRTLSGRSRPTGDSTSSTPRPSWSSRRTAPRSTTSKRVVGTSSTSPSGVPSSRGCSTSTATRSATRITRTATSPGRRLPSRTPSPASTPTEWSSTR